MNFSADNYYQDPLELANYQKLPLFIRKIGAKIGKMMPEGKRGKRF